MSRARLRRGQLSRSQEVDKGVAELAAFVWRRAEESAAEVGFGFRPSEHGPGSFAELQRQVRLAECSGLPLPVSARFSETAILGERTNVAFRFWHDLTHVRLRAGFDRSGEVAVGQQQLGKLEASGVRPHSLVWRLLFAETLAQDTCLRRTGEFPADQTRFTLDYLEHGLDGAIVLEAGRRAVERRSAFRVIPGGAPLPEANLSVAEGDAA